MSTCATPFLSDCLPAPSAFDTTMRVKPHPADVFRHARCGFAVLDRGLRVAEANPELDRLFGCDAGTMPGRRIIDLDDSESYAMLGAINAALLETHHWKGVIGAAQPGGAMLELEWTISSQSDSSMLLAVVTDVTGRMRAQREVERALELERAARAAAERVARLKDEFVAAAVHELRHPLAPMQNAVYLLQHAGAGLAADKARAVLDRQLRQMVLLVDDLMDIARLGHGAIELDKKCMSLDAAVEAALETSRPHMLAADQQLHVQHAGADVIVCIDAVRFGQTLVNVLNNASKYTPRGGRIDVRVSARSGSAQVVVADSGIGIPAERLADIFELFSQVHASHARSSGLGVGLAVAKQLMELHGGTISAHSAGVGQGSRFVLCLPLAERAVEPGPEELRRAPSATAGDQAPHNVSAAA